MENVESRFSENLFDSRKCIDSFKYDILKPLRLTLSFLRINKEELEKTRRLLSQSVNTSNIFKGNLKVNDILQGTIYKGIINNLEKLENIIKVLE